MERLTKDNGKAFEPFRYSLEDISTYKIYDLFYEITFKVLQKLGKYEDAEEQGGLIPANGYMDYRVVMKMARLKKLRYGVKMILIFIR